MEHGQIMLIDEESFKGRIYTIRGVQVMLDTDLAMIYGYSTKAFNQQVKNNLDKFDSDFMFQLADDEVAYLRSNYLTANIHPKSRSNPYAFTEQGIYMLMTVLRGDLAVRQSKMLIRLFKQMKDNLSQTSLIPLWQAVTSLTNQVGQNIQAIGEIREDITEVDYQLAETCDTLARFMASFGDDPFGSEFLILEGETLEAAAAYQHIYSLADTSIFIIDNYISVRTLMHLRHAKEGVPITLFSDNLGVGLTAEEFCDFKKENPTASISLRRTGGLFHDRFIILDYNTDHQRVFVCGASSKDAGKRITIVYESGIPKTYKYLIDRLSKQRELQLR